VQRPCGVWLAAHSETRRMTCVAGGEIRGVVEWRTWLGGSLEPGRAAGEL